MREIAPLCPPVSQEMAFRIECIARAAGDIALARFRGLADLPVEKKGHLDLVTEADRAVEEFLIHKLLESFPNDGVFGEEGANTSGVSCRTWVIDPIDGTFNFVRGGSDWAISIGLYQSGKPTFGIIYSPVRNLMFCGGVGVDSTLNGRQMNDIPPFDATRASTGLGFHPTIPTADRLEVVRFITDEMRISFRVCGSATMSMIAVAMGESDGYISLGDSTWDVMAALPILANLGAVDTIDWANVDLQKKLRFACGSKDFIWGVAPLLSRVGSEGTADA